MSLFININGDTKKISNLYASINGEKKKISSMWANKNDVPTKIYGNTKYIGNRFVCVGSKGNSYYSLDGETWTAMTGIPDDVILRSVTFGNNRFVCVGDDGASYYSSDGETWTAMTFSSGITSHDYNLNGVAFSGNRFVCVGATGESYFSLDGKNWNARALYLPTYEFNDIIYDGDYDRFVCVGDKGKIYSCPGTDFRWSVMADLSLSYSFSGVTICKNSDIPFGFVCTSSSGASYAYRTSKMSWEKISLNNASEIAYGDNVIVSVGTWGNTTYSLNGETWINSHTSSDANIYLYDTVNNIVYGNDRFVCVGSNSTGTMAYYSLDGKIWTAMTGLSDSGTLYGITYGE